MKSLVCLFAAALVPAALWSQDRPPDKPPTDAKSITSGVSMVLVNVVVLDAYGFVIESNKQAVFCVEVKEPAVIKKMLQNGRICGIFFNEW